VIPVLLALACTSGVPRTAESPEEKPPAASLVLVTLDTVRADRLGVYGHAAAVTPTLDALAATGIRFDRAYTDVPLTTPAHASIFTGLHPPHHGVHTNGGTALADDIVTLAEVLEGKGYATAAIASAFVTSRAWNLDQGFATYDDELTAVHAVGGRWMQERKADDTVDKAIAWLSTARPSDRPFFLWVHFYDAHAPYEPPRPWPERVPDPYDGEIAFVDSQLARLVPKVDEVVGGAGAVWVVVSDHGEALHDEHGEPSHGAFLFEPTMRVPFIVRPATPLAPGVVVPNVVSVVDVMPTALDLLGVDVPAGLDGVNQAGWARNSPVPDRPHAYMESRTLFQRFGYAPEIGFLEGNYKLMDTPSPKLFDVVADPRETTNRFDEKPEVVAALRAHIAAARGSERTSDGPIDPTNLQALEALGYVGATASTDASEAVVDGKDRTDVLALMDRAREIAQSRAGAQEAVGLYDKVLAIDPRLAEAWSARANAEARLGHLDVAIANVEKGLAAHPDSTVLETQLATFHLQRGDAAKALAVYEKALGHSPTNEYLRSGVIRALLKLDRRDDAIAKARAWLAQDPGALYMKGMLGVVLTQAGQAGEAERLLKESLQDPIPRPWIHYSLALIAYHRKDLKTAANELELELAAFPGDAEQQILRGRILFEDKRFAEAAEAFRIVAESEDKSVEGRIGWAQATLEAGDAEKALELLTPVLEVQKDNPTVIAIHHRILTKLGRTAEAEQVDKQFKSTVQKLQKRMESAKARAPAAP
jgi:arylsulfatase A-like enzyme/tetratricopeptide (TPR) repeat protein